MDSQRRSRPSVVEFPSPQTAMSERANVAEYISIIALDMAKQARAAGLTALGSLLETAALTAAADSVAARWPKDGT